jgi:hypothetical protein
MGEETLRAHFLVQLNGVYEGHATEEMLNFEGNTDILIRVGCDTFGPAMPNVEDAIELRSPPTIHPQPRRGGHGEWRQPARGSSRVGKQSGTSRPTTNFTGSSVKSLRQWPPPGVPSHYRKIVTDRICSFPPSMYVLSIVV